jgi:hypothetical protein
MTVPTAPPTRRFWAPAFGLVALFGLLGPAIGGAVAIPLVFALETADAVSLANNIGWVAAAIGHAFVLVLAYVFGLGPAIGAGLVYAIADSAAPPRAPRSLLGAAIGALFAYALIAGLIWLGTQLVGTIGDEWRAMLSDWIGSPFSEEGGDVLTKAVVISGAVAGLVCAMTASLMGLTTRPFPPVAVRQ